MFLVLLTYTAPLDEVDQHLAGHRQFLARNYAAGVFVLSGRRQPRTGGVILATSPSLQELEAVLAGDPFRVHGLADYQLIEFTPTLAAAGLESLIET